MIPSHCKVCEEVILLPIAVYKYCCKKCGKYSFALDSKFKLESETIRDNNYHFCFFINYKSAVVVEVDRLLHNRVVKQFDLNELTHELAVQWVNKLKTYKIFQ